MATKAQKARIDRWVSKWKSRLLLDTWSISVSYGDEDEKRARSDNEIVSAAAEVIVDQRYKEARITIYPVLFTRPLGYQQTTIVHEILHIVTDPVKQALDAAVRKGTISQRRNEDILEGITENFTKIVFKAHLKTNKSLGSYHV